LLKVIVSSDDSQSTVHLHNQINQNKPSTSAILHNLDNKFPFLFGSKTPFLPQGGKDLSTPSPLGEGWDEGLFIKGHLRFGNNSVKNKLLYEL